MQRILAAVLAAWFALQGAGAFAEAAGDTATGAAQGGSDVLTASDIAKLGRPVSDTPTHLTVGNPTQVSGMFFSDLWGNNTSDIDVRTLLSGYATRGVELAGAVRDRPHGRQGSENCHIARQRGLHRHPSGRPVVL